MTICHSDTVVDLQIDNDIQEKCYTRGMELMKDGGCDIINDKKYSTLADPWKHSDVHLVQYAAMQALGLLLRSNPGSSTSLFCILF